ncbi:hypothetical protein AHiyo1_48260 [Arthrobacter sp. Hiyo1]|nr:hypothetical protein AHiyo1_48260 [Arthrobacter sp. Hiyo1]
MPVRRSALARSLPFYGLQDGRKSGQGIVDLIERAAGLQRFSGDGQNHFAPVAEILGHDLEQRPGIHACCPGLRIVTGRPVAVTARTNTAAARAWRPISAATMALCSGKPAPLTRTARCRLRF